MSEEGMMKKRDELAAEIKRILDRKDAENATLRAELAEQKAFGRQLFEEKKRAMELLEAARAEVGRLQALVLKFDAPAIEKLVTERDSAMAQVAALTKERDAVISELGSLSGLRNPQLGEGAAMALLRAHMRQVVARAEAAESAYAACVRGRDEEREAAESESTRLKAERDEWRAMYSALKGGQS